MKIPQLTKKPEIKSCHGIKWEDNYSWVHQKLKNMQGHLTVIFDFLMYVLMIFNV